MHRKLAPPEEAELVFKAFHLLRPQAYDSHYLALAAILGLEFWTGDERLYNTVKHRLPWVKWLGDYQPG